MSSGGYGFPREPREIINVNGPRALRVAGIFLALLFSVILLWSSIVSVSAGHVAVLTLFGKVSGDVLPEGIHLVNPFKVAHEMSIRTQEAKEVASVPSSEGLVVNLDTSMLFRLDPSRAANLYQTVGLTYRDVVIEPNLRSSIRSATSAHSANALYSSDREKVAQMIFSELQQQLGKRGIIVESVLLRDIQLPPTLKQSIEEKQKAEQESLAMGFRLQKERQEAERKRIEAQGIRDFQQIVAQGISAQLLEWKGIEATESLAKSPNAKIVVIGSQKNGLPLILGQ